MPPGLPMSLRSDLTSSQRAKLQCYIGLVTCCWVISSILSIPPALAGHSLRQRMPRGSVVMFKDLNIQNASDTVPRGLIAVDNHTAILCATNSRGTCMVVSTFISNHLPQPGHPTSYVGDPFDLKLTSPQTSVWSNLVYLDSIHSMVCVIDATNGKCYVLARQQSSLSLSAVSFADGSNVNATAHAVALGTFDDRDAAVCFLYAQVPPIPTTASLQSPSATSPGVLNSTCVLLRHTGNGQLRHVSALSFHNFLPESVVMSRISADALLMCYRDAFTSQGSSESIDSA